jgi:hypothetical protein
MHAHRLVAMLALCLVLPAASAVAQTIGTFRWQIQPHCNVITVRVTHQSGIYTLDGTDDRCGADQAASVVGIAHLTASRLVGFGLTSVLPGGTAVHTEATISIASLSGTWRDSVGNNGSFVFTPGAGTGGAARPIPAGGIAAASITNVHLANNAITGANIVDASITSADISDGVRLAFSGGDLPPTTFFLSQIPTIISSVTVNAPAAGKVVVNASAGFRFSSNVSSEYARCELTTSATTITSQYSLAVGEIAPTAILEIPFSTTRGFNVPAGNTTFYWLCYEVFFGTDVRVSPQFMTAIYSPR